MTNDQKRVNTSKFNIRQALNSVGVNVPADTPLDEYPPYIAGMSGGNTPILCDVTVTNNYQETGFYGAIYDATNNVFIGECAVPNDGEAHTFKVVVDTKMCTNINLSLSGIEVETTGGISHLDVTAPYEKNVFMVSNNGTISLINTNPPA